MGQLEKKLETEERPHLFLNIVYDVKKDTFTIEGDVKEEKRADLISEFLRGQIGEGKDKREPNKQETYNIRLTWYPDKDDIICNFDTGNKGLRDGILYRVLKDLK